MDRNAAYMGSGKAEEVRESVRGGFFDDSEGRGDLVNVEICVEDGEDEFRSEADGVSGGVKFVQEALVPCVDRILEDFFQ